MLYAAHHVYAMYTPDVRARPDTGPTATVQPAARTAPRRLVCADAKTRPKRSRVTAAPSHFRRRSATAGCAVVTTTVMLAAASDSKAHHKVQRDGDHGEIVPAELAGVRAIGITPLA